MFELADQSIDFVLSKLNRYVGTRQQSIQAPVQYDIPKEVVSEAIVNAIVHRDYTSPASVEVVLYSDRLEVWNPGQLPKGLLLQDLAQPHSSYPANPLLAEPMFLAKYIEKAGTGTTDIIEKCQQAGLPTPKFEVKAGCFVLTVYKAQDVEGVSGGVSGGVKSLLEFIKANPGLSAKLIAEQLEQPMRTTERWLKKLKDQNKIEFRGVPKTGGYYEK